MHDYLTFESEFDRLKKYFLLEGVGGDDDLEEGTSEDDDGKEEKKGKKEKKDGKSESEDTGDIESDDESESDGESDDDTDGLTDLDGDSDLDDLTGNPGDAPSEDDVNKDNGAPGAINPENLIRELTSGEDNIYARVGKAMAEKFPGKHSAKEIETPLRKVVAHAVKSFMKNKNYAPLPREAMRGVCDNLANAILKKAVVGGSQQAGKPRQAPTANEAVYYVRKAPVFEAEEMMEGALANIATAAAIGLGAANAANAATAGSAPESTLRANPAYVAMAQKAGQKADQKKAETVKKDAGSSSSATQSSASVPNAKDPKTVVFSDDSSYTLTPDDYVAYKLANNLPKNYTVSGGSAGSPAGTQATAVQKPTSSAAKQGAASSSSQGTRGVQKAGTGSATQAAVKGATKSSVGKGKTASAERCEAPQEEEKSEGWGKMLHRWAHKAVDKGGEIGAGLVGGAIGAAKGAYHGANAGYRYAKDAIDSQHDEMIGEHDANK